MSFTVSEEDSACIFVTPIRIKLGVEERTLTHLVSRCILLLLLPVATI